MVNALLKSADFTGDALALVAVVVAALSLMCLLVAGRAVHADRPLPRGLLVLTGAGMQMLLILVLSMVVLQGAIEILAAGITP